MGAAKLSLLIGFAILSIGLSAPMVYGRDMNLDLKLSSEEEIVKWAKSSFFGGYHHDTFTKDGRELIVLVGMPTGGVLTSQVIVFGKSKHQTAFCVLLATGVIYSDIQVKEDARGIVVSKFGEEILLIPFGLADIAEISAPRPASENARSK